MSEEIVYKSNCAMCDQEMANGNNLLCAGCNKAVILGAVEGDEDDD